MDAGTRGRLEKDLLVGEVGGLEEDLVDPSFEMVRAPRASDQGSERPIGAQTRLDPLGIVPRVSEYSKVDFVPAAHPEWVCDLGSCARRT